MLAQETGETTTLKKMERDFSPDVDALLPSAQTLAKNGNLAQAIEQLLVLEKQTRVGSDMLSNSRVLIAVCQLCFETGDWKQLQEQLISLSKKHGLIKASISKMVQEAITYIEKTPNASVKLEFIETLRTITEGKIYVEVERARVTKILAEIKEAEGNINEAADILQELQVETFGSMEKREKTDFILEQMRLNLARNDFTRAQIVSKKINTKYFEKEQVQDLKLRYYELMIQHALHESKYLDACKYYREVYDTKSVQESEPKWTEILQYIVIFIVLAPFDNEQSDLIHRIAKDKKLDSLPLYKKILNDFITQELIDWIAFGQSYMSELEKTFAFLPESEDGAKRKGKLFDRVIEHNLRTISAYYDRISLKRLTELLGLSLDDAERFLSNLVSSKTIYAKIDRVDGIVSFEKSKEPDEVVNEWSHGIHSLLDLIAQTKHLISKEEMVHSITKISS